MLWLAWGWYVVPLGVPPASYRHVLGLDLTLALARMRVGERDEPRKAWAGAALTIGVFLVMLWLAHFGVRS